MLVERVALSEAVSFALDQRHDHRRQVDHRHLGRGSARARHLEPMGSASHLVTRFFGSLRSGPPNAADLRWARSRLSDGEWLLFERMSNPDQRHSVEVARAVVGALPDAEPEVIAAAFLHDVGKVESGFGTRPECWPRCSGRSFPDRLADSWLRGPLPLRSLLSTGDIRRSANSCCSMQVLIRSLRPGPPTTTGRWRSGGSTFGSVGCSSSATATDQRPSTESE